MFGHEWIQNLFYSYIPFERIFPQLKVKKDIHDWERKVIQQPEYQVNQENVKWTVISDHENKVYATKKIFLRIIPNQNELFERL